MDRVKELECILKEASYKYYNTDSPTMSDKRFDELRDELETLNPNNKFLKDVGSKINSKLAKTKHSIAMGSLNKITTEQELHTWLKSVIKIKKDPLISLSLKLDGCSIELIYVNGLFKKAITRGDGIEGEDVTHNIIKSKHLPHSISIKDRTVSVRCECLLSIDDYKNHFKENSNARNTVSGLVRRLDGTGSEYLICVAFDVSLRELKTEEDKMNWLRNENFSTVENKIVEIEDIISSINKIEEKRNNLIYEIDGVVLKVNDVPTQKALGEHNQRPYFAKAWKFKADREYSVVENITWSVGSDGRITPVANITPVEICGAIVRNVSLSNMDEIERLNISTGDEVEVIRAGDIIPKIIRVVKRNNNRKTIELNKCPICKSDVKRNGPFYICQNKENCIGVVTKRFKKWIKKINIMFLGDVNLSILLSTKIVTSIDDLYRLKISDMIRAGISSGMATKIYEQIQLSRECSLSDMIGSLSIDMLGRSQAADLKKRGINTIERWKALSVNQIIKFPGYQLTKATRIVNSLRKNWELIEKMYDVLDVILVEKITKDKQKTGDKTMVVCLTGKMTKSRSEIVEILENAGCEISKSINKKVTHLCQANPNSKSSKTLAAAKLGIPVISEEELYNIIG